MKGIIYITKDYSNKSITILIPEKYKGSPISSVLEEHNADCLVLFEPSDTLYNITLTSRFYEGDNFDVTLEDR